MLGSALLVLANALAVLVSALPVLVCALLVLVRATNITQIGEMRFCFTATLFNNPTAY